MEVVMACATMGTASAMVCFIRALNTRRLVQGLNTVERCLLAGTY